MSAIVDMVRDRLQEVPGAALTPDRRAFDLRQAVDRVDEARTKWEEREALLDLAAMAVLCAERVAP